ncbi:MAG TPA: sulfite exporter TauE/SafE family protein, partial [Micropruina sp.]|nr:sulfite exporter TauE/SafE family protein [Micropruina sp.]
LSAGKTAPRTVIGSVDTSEFMVSTAASIGFLVGLGTAGIDFGIVAALLIGGVIAAPIAAWLVSRIPAQIMGVAVGGLIVLTNTNTIFSVSSISGPAAVAGLLAVLALWITLVVRTILRHRARRAVVSASGDGEDVTLSAVDGPDAVKEAV